MADESCERSPECARENRHHGPCRRDDGSKVGDCAYRMGKGGGVDGERLRPPPCSEDRDPKRPHACWVHSAMIDEALAARSQDVEFVGRRRSRR